MSAGNTDRGIQPTPGSRALGPHPPVQEPHDVFADLMARRVREIVLVSSLYDTFILREDGRVGEAILGEFLELNLHHTSGLTHVSTGSQALELARQEPNRFNLIVTSVNAGDMDAAELAERAKSEASGVPVVLLAYDGGELNEFLSRRPTHDLERIFLWPGDTLILLAIVKYMEDKWNVAYDTGVVGVPIILVIEDNVRYYSSFLPMIYREVIRHSQGVISEASNITEKILRMRARPKILLCSSWEEAFDYFERYPDEILGVISDIEFPRQGRLDPEAGIEFALAVTRRWPDVQVILQSSRPENAAQAKAVGASFLLKGSATFMTDLRNVVVERLYLGDFVFRLPDGRAIDRAQTVQELVDKLHRIPVQSLRYHADRNHFSRWLKTRTEFELAAELRPMRSTDYASNEETRQVILQVIERYRRRRRQRTITDYSPSDFDPETSFARVGEGSLGGKGRALAFMRRLLAQPGVEDYWPGIRITVPPCLVLATDIFDAFLEANDLRAFALACDNDKEVGSQFQQAVLPPNVSEALREFLEVASYPLAVRSSSLLEDSQYQPLAGVYRTFMIPNNHPDLELRLRQLEAAIKQVYASTFSQYAKKYFQMTPYRLEEEKMAVIIQRVVGSPHGTHFYPDLSGVARSLNFYPTPPMRVEDGVVAAALGLGRTVVEGRPSYSFCPRFPDRPMGYLSTEDLLKFGQREFVALDLRVEDICCKPEEILHEVSLPLEVAEREGTLSLLASVYSPEDDRLYDGLRPSGIRLVTLAPILKHRALPLADIICYLLELGRWGMNTEVEIEFACDLTPAPGRPREFAFLQIRPMATTRRGSRTKVEIRDPQEALCVSNKVLGDGRRDDLFDIVVVDVDRFDRAATRQIAMEVARLNADLTQQGVPYILIGPGRWGSADPWLGIPVTWEQISGARVIVESGMPDLRVAPSQGSHFFQNLTTFRVGYFTVNEQLGEGRVDWAWLAAQPALSQSAHVRHLRFPQPLVVMMDGLSQNGAILKPGLRSQPNEARSKPAPGE